MNLVFTFSRRYGAGTSAITEELSKRFNIPIYGRDYICRGVHDENNLSEQRGVIENLAKNPCIIVGRGAADVLSKQNNVVNIFVYASRDDRIERISDKEHISREEAADKVDRVDEERRIFYEENTGKYWGDMDVYDIILDTSEIPIEKGADVIERYLRYMGDI